MEALLIYIAKAAGLMAVFYLAYYFLLRKETFFSSNRTFLLGGLITSAIMPLLVFTKTVWVEPAPSVYKSVSLDELMLMQKAIAQPPKENPVDWLAVVATLYATGIIFFCIKFIIELLAVRRLLKGHVVIKNNGYKYIDSEKVESPFSFFNYIVYNSGKLSEAELQSIISHERVHSTQKHSIDMIISQLFCIAFWFNPFAWLYRKAVAQNLEFIADAEAAKEIKDITTYQKTLLKITVQPKGTAIINHFYQSLIKKRIVMLNREQSKKRNTWKFAVVLPALAAFMFTFQLQVQAQVKEQETDINEEKPITISSAELGIDKNSDEAKLETDRNYLMQTFGAEVEFSGIKRNGKGEITAIKVTVKTQDSDAKYEVSGDEAIKPFTLHIEKDKDAPAIAYFGSQLKNGAVKAKQLKIYNNTPLPPVPPSVNFPAPPAAPVNGWSVNDIKIDNEDMLIVINGQKQEKGEKINLPLNQDISTVKILDKKEAKKKYGRDGKKGAVEITTKPTRVAGVDFISHAGPNGYLNGGMNTYMSQQPANNSNIRSFTFSTSGEISSEELSRLAADKTYILQNLDIPEIKAADLSDIYIEDFGKLKNDKQQIENNERFFISGKAEMDEARKDLEEARKDLEHAREVLKAEREKIAEERKKMMEERKKEFEKNKKQ
ncbi:M56 family metallopeptidase [Flavobacterium rhizosphaerae]|uniref:M56 family metallopeptidase n=1 Tax=Flavobacterium rhizosphaerae TaxID=3163298 RepID=A0ABW8YTB4_9FLAO